MGELCVFVCISPHFVYGLVRFRQCICCAGGGLYRGKERTPFPPVLTARVYCSMLNYFNGQCAVVRDTAGRRMAVRGHPREVDRGPDYRVS